MRYRCVVGLVLASLATCLVTCAGIAAQEFRIASEVYVGDETEPVSENLTLFRGSVVYDFLSRPAEIAIFRNVATSRGGRFILLDPDHRIRAEVTTERITSILDQLRRWAATQNDPLLRFAAHPRFEEHFDVGKGVLRLESDLMRYVLKTQKPKQPAVTTLYRDYSDWYGRLASITHVGSLPPFPRLAANEALARRERLAREVQLTIPADASGRGEDVVMRAEHQIQWRLSKRDLRRIDEADQYLVTFRPVTYDEFVARRRQSP